MTQGPHTEGYAALFRVRLKWHGAAPTGPFRQPRSSTTAQLRHRTGRFEPRRREGAKERRSNTPVLAFILASRLRVFAVQIDAAILKLRCSRRHVAANGRAAVVLPQRPLGTAGPPGPAAHPGLACQPVVDSGVRLRAGRRGTGQPESVRAMAPGPVRTRLRTQRRRPPGPPAGVRGPEAHPRPSTRPAVHLGGRLPAGTLPVGFTPRR